MEHCPLNWYHLVHMFDLPYSKVISVMGSNLNTPMNVAWT